MASRSSSTLASAKRAPKKSGTLSPKPRRALVADEDRLLSLFAQNMRLVRKHRGLSQEALADECGLDRTYVSGIERKRRNLSIRNIQRIADALQVDVRQLFDPDLADDPRFTG